MPLYRLLNYLKKEEFMQKKIVTKKIKNSDTSEVLELLGKSIARWTDKGDQHETAIPGLSLHQRE
jgi:hypothetical protein